MTTHSLSTAGGPRRMALALGFLGHMSGTERRLSIRLPAISGVPFGGFTLRSG
jgi:hypothetical protein